MSDWITVARAADIPPGAVQVVTAGDKRLAICHVVAGEEDCQAGFYAIEDLCTHDGGLLDQGELLGCKIECPRHGALFDVTNGKAMCLPAIQPVPCYALRVEGEDIQVSLDAPVAQEGAK